MSKKLTIIWALAALLFAIPSSGQGLAEKAFKKQQKLEFSQNFTQKSLKPSKTALLRAVESKKNEFWNLMEENLVGSKSMVNSIFNSAPRSVTTVMSNQSKKSRRAETVDEHGVIIAPAEGVVKYYTRSGIAYYYNNKSEVWASTNQEGHVELVECADGTVYFKNPISTLNYGSYVKGTKIGNTITIPAGQSILYNSEYNATVDIAWGTTAGPTADQPDFTFTVDGNTLTLENTNSSALFACFWSDEKSMQGADYGTVLTLDTDYAPASTDFVEAPAGLTLETWNTNLDGTIGTALVGFDGDDVYVKGLFTDFPDSWIKGTVSGTTVTFSKLQFVGTYNNFNIWMAGYDATTTSKLGDIVMTYDALSKVMTGTNIILNAADDKLYTFEVYAEVAIQEAPVGEPVIKTGAPIDILPYMNSLATAEEYAEFGVLDANKDKDTWFFNPMFGTVYNFGNVDADDWIVSPAIKLEAGKVYHFTLDAHSKDEYNIERLEVKMAADAKESALKSGTTIIAPTTIATANFITLDNGEVTVSETGYYHFGIHAISDADVYTLYIANFLIEEYVATAPAAVSDFTVIPFDNGSVGATIQFKAPSKTLAGEELTDNIAKIKILRDEEVIKTFEDVAPGTVQTYVDNTSVTVGKHNYQVISCSVDATGGKSDVVSALLKGVVDVPYTADFSQKGTIDLFSVIDANADCNTWQWNASNKAFYSYGTVAADDYLVSLPIRLKAGKTYDVIVNAHVAGKNFPERFEVKVGKTPTPEGLTMTAIEPTVIASESATDYDGSFSVAEDGNYYVAIHAISDAEEWRLSINSLTIKNGVEPKAPAAVTDFVATSGAMGALEVNLSFKAPVACVDGSAPDGLMTASVYRDGVVVKNFENVAYGSVLSWKDETVEDGKIYIYQVIPANAVGTGLKSDKCLVYVGNDVPSVVENVTAKDQPAGILFSWDAVGNVGPNGGYVDPAKVSYKAWTVTVETYYGINYPILEQQIGHVAGATSLVAPFNTEEGEQKYNNFAIEPVNAVGKGEASYTSLLIGKSYDLPLIESFTDAKTHYFVEGSEGAGTAFSQDASDGDASAILLTSMENVGNVGLASGKINLNNVNNPTLLFDVKSSTLKKLNVLGSVDGQEFTIVQANVPVSSEYTTIKVPLANLKNGRYARLAITAFIANPYYEGATNIDFLAIDNIRVVDLREHNLGVTVTAPAKIKAGHKATVTAVVENKGEQVANAYGIVIKAGEKELMNVDVDEMLLPFKTRVLNADFETSVFDEAGDVNITAQVVYEGDQDLTDNTDDVVVCIKEPTVSAPTSLTAEDKGSAGVDLSWTVTSAGDVTSIQVTENFDDQDSFEPFCLGGITTSKHLGNIADWTLYDGNGITVYGFNDVKYPHKNEVAAWQVLNLYQISGSMANAYAPHSGDQLMISFCPVDDNDNAPAANHWLISPQLPGEAQTISFYARAITSKYGTETFEVLTSSTDKNVESFTKVADYTTTATEWEAFTVDLPTGTKYFAIRHTSKDVFGLMVDDVTFNAVGSLEAPTSFNIYYECEKIAAVEGGKTTYTIAAKKLTAGEHTFSVTAVYANGGESKPVTAKVMVTTDIRQIAVDGKPIDIYSVDGRLLRRQVMSLNGLKGVFVVNGKKILVK